jgi:hypothetical protein
MSLNTAIGLSVLVIFLTATGFIPYLLGRRLLGQYVDKNVKEGGVLLYRAVGVLLIFMLSLNFVDIRSEYVKV